VVRKLVRVNDAIIHGRRAGDRAGGRWVGGADERTDRVRPGASGV
jgi:hypothetical protein